MTTKRRTASISKQIDVIAGIKQQLFGLAFRKFVKKALTFEEYLQCKDRMIYQHPSWDRLTRTAQSEILGYARAMYDYTESILLFSHVSKDNKRLLSRYHLHEKFIESYSEIDTDLSYHCLVYYIRGLVYVPWREDDRKKEIESGRLTQVTIDIIGDWGQQHQWMKENPGDHIYFCRPRWKQNGQLEITQEIIYDSSWTEEYNTELDRISKP